MALCPNCGNEVPDANRCPVCAIPRPAETTIRKEGSYVCPRCNEALDLQSWEGTPTRTCPTCRGTFFQSHTLETVLNKLRASCESVDIESVLHDFKDRFTRGLPTTVRYKACPICATVMTRRNYATVSGVVVDFCGDHGIWVDEHSFAELADFICRGGDMLAEKASSLRMRARRTGGKGRGPGLIDKLFGS